MERFGALGLGLIQLRSETRRLLGLPAVHRDHLALDIEPQRADEPARQLTQGEPVPHRQRARADEALPAGAQLQALHRPPGRIRTIENPHRLARSGGFLQHVAQRRDEGVDATAEILQIDQQHIEGVHHRGRRPAHGAVETEHGNAVQRIDVVGRLHHVVLLVAAQAMLRPEGGGEPQRCERRERIERMCERTSHRGRVSQQRHTPSQQRLAQRRFFEQTLDAEFHTDRNSSAKLSG
jgi:hypothetical protein